MSLAALPRALHDIYLDFTPAEGGEPVSFYCKGAIHQTFSALPNPPDSRSQGHLIGPPRRRSPETEGSEWVVADEGESDVRSESGAPVAETAPQVGGRRKHGVTVRRALLVVIGACLAITIGLAGWLYWTHPSTTTASLPDGAQRGEEEYLSGALPPPVTRQGMLRPGPLHSRRLIHRGVWGVLPLIVCR